MNKHVYTGARILLGLIFFVFGLNGFLNFIPQPPMEDPTVLAFMGGLMGSGYFFPVLKATEVICGALLLANWYVPLALVILAPITLNIVLFHRILMPGPPLDLVMLVLHGLLGWGYQAAYKPLFMKKSTPK